MPMYVLHIVAGALALVAGYVALASRKGGEVHRRVGMGFVWTMLPMCALGLVLTITRDAGVEINIPAAITTSYLVITALTTVRPPTPRTRRIDATATAIMAIAAVVTLWLGIDLATSGRGTTPDGIPPFPFFMFGTIGVLGVLGDARVLRSGARTGAPRLVRHLWRMCFALFIAAMSFFIGQADEFPKWMRIYPLLAVPALVALGAIGWWTWRLRVRRLFRGIVTVGAPLTR